MSPSGSRCSVQPLTIVALASTLLAAGLLAARFQRESEVPAAASSEHVRSISNVEELAVAGVVEGPPRASRRIVVFIDFGCRYCRALEFVLDSVRSQLGGDLAVIYRHYPLRALTFEAAQVAECAARVGKFTPVKRALYASGDSLGRTKWADLVRSAGIVDTLAFVTCMRAPEVTDRISDDVRAGERIFIRGTPAVLVGARLFDGKPSTEMLVRAARAAHQNP